MAAPGILQYKDNEGPLPGASEVSVLATTFTSNVSNGSAIVAFGTTSDYAVLHTDPKFTDTRSNTYVKQDQANTNQSGGASSVFSFVASNVTGGSDTVTQGYTTVDETAAYFANFLIEVGSVAASPLVGHAGNVQNALGTGTNNVVSGNIAVSSGQVPCIMLAVAMNSSLNGSTNRTPAVGTGMTQIAQDWAWDYGVKTATFAYQNITTAGTYQAIFSQTSNKAEDMACIAVILQGMATGAVLTAAASNVSTAVASLSTAISMVATATDATGGAAGLIGYQSVTLVAPLYTGAGGLLDPEFHWDNTPAPGDTILYDGTYLTILPDGELNATSNNFNAYFQFDDGTGPESGIITFSPNMEAYGYDTSAGAGVLSSGTSISGTAFDLTNAAAALNSQITLTAAGLDSTTGSGLLQTAAQMMAAATDVTTANAALFTAIELFATATTNTTAAAVLQSPGASLAAHATDTTISDAQLSAQITLTGAASDVITASASLSTHILFTAQAMDAISAHATLSTKTPLAGHATDALSASASLLTEIVVIGAARDFTTAGATLYNAIHMIAAAFDITWAHAWLTNFIVKRSPNNQLVT